MLFQQYGFFIFELLNRVIMHVKGKTGSTCNLILLILMQELIQLHNFRHGCYRD